MSVLDYAKAGMYASDARFGTRRGLSDPSIVNNLGNRGGGAGLKVGLITGALFIASLSPIEWHKFNSGITVTGAGVSQWDDASGAGNHSVQGTDANRPAKQTDGSILFDGATHLLKAVGYALVQPETLYVLGRQVTWTSGDRVFDGNTNNSGRIAQATASPQVSMFAGSALSNNSDWILNKYGVVCCVFNGANSSIQVDLAAPVTGNAGNAAMGGLTLGALSDGTVAANVQLLEVVLFPTGHSGITKSRMITYAAGVGNLLI